ncbi:DUF4303 domain-containing protein [Anatilimnocola sp. NA78]|uniref:DUF4303 domain-containing protein n=1 Tax=Anatilimnocola sp. NA78 TaxID=3415683 RepID=UPI003CE49B9D
MPYAQQQLIEVAIREGYEAFAVATRSFPADTFYAFCFYADAELTSIYPHANTLESLAQVDSSADANYFKWAPAEWQLDFGQYGDPGLMPETNRLLRQSYADLKTDDEFAARKKQMIATLSEALLSIKRSSVFQGHADLERLACWVNIGDLCGEQEWMFAPVIDEMPADVVEELRQLFEFEVQRKRA